ncbi:c-type cytochrome [Alteribacter natronophilus]|uniref:c-type cytochrome n=1 Tax=Alteribacter natronophilus TaxID=2583810 RepID=UPI00110F2F20|nr:cytochrome c [Alteribacter natronophilus]TMW73841.1 cytochrome c [Alteribacter natronophilus]
MKGKPFYPFAVTAMLGILVMIVLSFIGNFQQADIAQEGENGEEEAAEEEFDDPIELGEHLYEQNCLACHGGDLGGGSGPALDGGYSEEEIITAIDEGPGSMPAGLVSGEEAEAVAEYIISETE